MAVVACTVEECEEGGELGWVELVFEGAGEGEGDFGGRDGGSCWWGGRGCLGERFEEGGDGDVGGGVGVVGRHGWR